MSNLQKLEFAALSVSGDNYLKWALDIEIHLQSKGLGTTIEAANNAPVRDKFSAVAIIRHHLAEPLKDQYLTVKDPLDLWVELKSRYDHQKTVALPDAQYDWQHLRFQDFKSVEEYNSALFKIVAILRLCGETVSDKALIEKTLSTMHTSNTVLQQQYRERNYEKFSSLISCLLLAEKNNEILVKNTAMRPPGTAPLPEAHDAERSRELPGPREAHHMQRGRGRGRWSGPRRGRGRGRGGYEARDNRPGPNIGYGGGRGGYEARDNRPGNNIGYGGGRGRGRGIQKPKRGVCLRCGMANHWARTCRTAKHLVDLYQKGNPEANVAHHDGEGDFDYERDDSLDYETADVLKGDEE